MKVKSKEAGEMSIRQAERILETFENASRNGNHWAHDVVLQRGKDNYQRNIDQLNEAFRLKSIDVVIKPLARKIDKKDEQLSLSMRALQSQRGKKQRGLP